MDNNKKILIAILIILVVAMVFFDYGNFTGQVVKSSSVVTISPNTIKQSDYIEINAVPTVNGISKKFYICDDEDSCRWHSTLKICQSYKCANPFSARYKIGDWEPGVYYVKFYDYSLKDYIKTYFTVEEYTL